MELNEIWRFDLVRGFSGDPSQGACLLTAVSWLVDGKLTDRPKSVCPLLAQWSGFALAQRRRAPEGPAAARAFVPGRPAVRDSSSRAP